MIGITPSEVSDNIATAFLVALEEEGIIRNPRQVHRTMCIVWNRAEESIAAWPRSRLPVPQYRRAYSLSWRLPAFPRQRSRCVLRSAKW